MEALESTGIMIVPGSGFGQVPATHHFRITNLVNSHDEMTKALDRLAEFNNELMNTYKD